MPCNPAPRLPVSAAIRPRSRPAQPPADPAPLAAPHPRGHPRPAHPPPTPRKEAPPPWTRSSRRASSTPACLRPSASKTPTAIRSSRTSRPASRSRSPRSTPSSNGSSTAGALKTYAIEHNGRLRKYYRITDKGRRRIDDFCASWSEMVRIHDYIEGARHDQA